MPYTVFEGAGPSICYGDRKGPDRAKPSKAQNPSRTTDVASQVTGTVSIAATNP